MLTPHQPRISHDQINLIAMILLTATTGMVDAIGYLGLDRVFTANMTGNVVILAIGATGTDGLPVAGPAAALAAYVCGAVIAGRVLRHVAAGWHRREAVCLWITGLLVLALAPAVLVLTPVHGSLWALSITAVLGLAMGIQAATARKIAVVDVTTVVVTSTVTALAADSFAAGGSSPRWQRRTAAIAALTIGAAIGAVLVRFDLALSFAVAGFVILAIVTCAAIAHKKYAPRSDKQE